MPSHPLTHFEIQKYDQIKPKFKCFSQKNLPKLKNGAHIKKLDEYEQELTGQHHT